MANPLQWKEGGGYDIHLLRGGLPVNRLIDRLELGSVKADSVAFIPQLEGGTAEHGVELDAGTGTVRALMHPNLPSWPRVHNFLLSVVGVDAHTGDQRETEIRIHVHDSVKDLWLTPSTLTIHQGDKCRFTVLAHFKNGNTDGIVGDITDWTELSYRSVDEGAVKVLSGGLLQAQAPGLQSDITVTLNLVSPPTNERATAKAITKASWADTGGAAKVNFVAGKVAPNKDDPASVKTVVDSATNILFVAEGFRQDQRGDFNNLVWKVTEELRTKDYLLPFKLLKDSINYWSVFIPSEQEGVSLLGDYRIQGISPKLTGSLVPLPRKPAPSATEWSLEEMIHEVGLPVPEEVEVPFMPDHVRRWQKLYGVEVTEDRVRKSYGAWVALLGLRSLLDERDSAFGMATGDRPRASTPQRDRGDRQSISLRYDFRRTSEASILEFVQSLRFAGHPIGSTWQPQSASQPAGKDFGFVAFVCLSDWHAGEQQPGKGYLTASFGRKLYARLKPVADSSRGLDIMTAPPEENSRTLCASVVAHECGHVFGLGDEYGNGEGTDPAYGPAVSLAPNLQAKSEITTTTTDPATGTQKTVFDKTKNIKWLWPRVIKAGVLDGTPTRSGTGFRVQLRKGHGRAFRFGDMVWFREWPVVHVASSDPFLLLPRSIGLVYKVKAHDDDGVNVDLEDASGVVVDVDAEVSGVDPGGPGPARWADIIPRLFSQTSQYALICPRSVAGIELKLVAEPIFKHIASTSLLTAGPLTAEPGVDPALCVADRRGRGFSSQTPTNLPRLSNEKKLIKQDIIGIYEGGGYHDCGIFRPAGRCKMRTVEEKTIPFCHVCRYLIVDRVDPTKHGELDNYYPEVSI